MAAGQVALEISIPKSQLATDVTEDTFACPTDLLCIADDCKAQDEGKDIAERQTLCKTVSCILQLDMASLLMENQEVNYGCKCRKVNYPHHTLVKHGYTGAQNEWLQQLIKLADLPEFQTECRGGKQHASDSKTKFKE